MPEGTSDLGRAVQDVAQKAQLLVREEIELAKAEMSAKANKLIKGIVAGAVAGIFALLALFYLLDALAWGFWSLVGDGDDGWIWLGFLFVGLLLLVLGAIAGFLAARWIKKGSPPKPQMAIEEAQLIRQTIQSSSSTEVRR